MNSSYYNLLRQTIFGKMYKQFYIFNQKARGLHIDISYIVRDLSYTIHFYRVIICIEIGKFIYKHDPQINI